jgi:murein DD-endopeptidase MepM/ murein hydrolase activator NlpD
MKNLIYTVVLLASSCGPVRSVFHKDSPREAYERHLEKAGIDETPEGIAWKAAAQFALTHPHPISLPYRHAGSFGNDKPRALALRFTAKEGQHLLLRLEATDARSPVYAELFREDSSVATLLLPADPALNEVGFDVPATGSYLLRLQSQLGKASNYALALESGPSLAFPVSSTAAKAGSFWGADRDGGARRHEGVDIFAAKGSPAVAAANGTVTEVQESRLGGKYVFLRPDGKNYSLYYAHLDQQLVQTGQHVLAGETLGLVGNTGNARNTPAHLHFGIYTWGGAIDPYPFINRSHKAAAALPENAMPTALKLKKPLRDGAVLPANTVLAPLAVTAKGYLAESPDGTPLLLPFGSVTAMESKS